MDLQKTGALIAQRRKELTLTQKELAEMLHISDRTVSKWERGVGFPELALLEPLADALGLSVLELLHGEKIPQPAHEDTARDTVRSLNPIIRNRLKKARGWLYALGGLLAAALVVLLLLLVNPNKAYIVAPQTITAADAAERCPYILITTDEFKLGQQLRADPDIQALLSDDACLTVDAEISSRYAGALTVHDLAPEHFAIDVVGHTIYVDLVREPYRCILTCFPDGTIHKLCSQRNGKRIFAVDNADNQNFYIYNEKRDLLAPLREDFSE